MLEALRLARWSFRLTLEGIGIAVGRTPAHEREHVRVCALCGGDTPEDRVAFEVADLAVCEGCQGESAPVS